ncbi:MAG: hypothetical protein GY754_20730 [bacterium]|nr:hypothetical protein [bacterium]
MKKKAVNRQGKATLRNVAFKIVSIILMINIFILSAPEISQAQGNGFFRACSGSMNTLSQADVEEETLKEQAQGTFCPLQYIVYFIWFAFVVVATILIFIADLVTGFSNSLISDFFDWVGEKTKSLDNWFASLGCD